MIVGVVFVLLAVWAGVAVSTAAAAYRHDKAGLTLMNGARSGLNPTSATSGSTQAQLTGARSEFAAASSDLSSPLVGPLTWVPVLGRQLRAAQAMSSGADQVAGVGVDLLGGIHRLINQPHGAGRERVNTLRALAAQAGTAEARLRGVSVGPQSGLVQPLAAKQNEFVSQLNEAVTRLGDTASAARVGAELLAGPRRYLVLAGNNAEMRAGSGGFLDVGVATMNDGSVTMSPFVPSGQLSGSTVGVSSKMAHNWGWLNPGADWRNLGVDASFADTAALAAQMWAAQGGGTVDGVIAIDVVGLSDLLAATGPVDVNGTSVNAASVTGFLLHDQYAGMSDDGSTAISDTTRQDQLGALAKATLSAAQSQQLNIKALSSAMGNAVCGRHLMIWSSRASDEAVWVTCGVAGTLDDNSVGAMLINRGGNKLDWFIQGTNAVSIQHESGGAWVQLTSTYHNTVGPGEAQFVAGPYPGLGTKYGEYRGLVSDSLPGRAQHISVTGGAVLTKSGQGPTWLVNVPVDFGAGTSKAVSMRFWLSGSGTMRVVPSARAGGTIWQYGGSQCNDGNGCSISW